MNVDDWKYHRGRAISIQPFGLCSRMQSGLIKIEGEIPMTEGQVLNWVYTQRDVRDPSDKVRRLKALV